MAEVRWTVTARDDVRAIWEFIARDSPAHAERQVLRVTDAVERLRSFPTMGRLVPEFEREGLREIIQRSYRIIYRVEGGAVTVLRVIHGARDLRALVEREPWELSE